MLLLTAVDYFAVKVASAIEVLGGAVPASVLELMLTLGDGLFGSFGHSNDDARMVANQTSLLASQRRVHVRIQIRVGDGVLFDGVGDQIVWLPRSCNSPI